MLKNLQKRNQGFTIVEVMIVLAIAGLIILVVLLAVPALQRNSRNTSIKSDASSLAAAINDFQGVNDGRMPTDAAGIGTYNITSTVPNTTPVEVRLQGSTRATAVAATPTDVATGALSVRIGAKCNGTASARSAAVFYSLENQNTRVVRCVEA